MLIIAGTFTLEPDHVDRAMEIAGPMCSASQAEEGCLDYVFTVNPNVPGELRLFERWVDESALEAHFATPHMAIFREQLGGLDVRGRDVARHEVSVSTPM